MGPPHGYTDDVATAADAAARAALFHDPPALEAEDAGGIRAILARHHTSHVCHVTTARSLPAIAAHRGLLSSYVIEMLTGVRAEASTNRPERRRWSRAYVFYSFWPGWWLCEKLDEELVILVIDAGAVCLQRDALFAPDQRSARTVFGQHRRPRLERIATLADCFTDSGPRTKAEIAAGRVSLAAIRTVVFCDDEAREYWWRRFIDAVDSLDRGIDVRAAVSRHDQFTFPSDFRPSIRHRPDC